MRSDRRKDTQEDTLNDVWGDLPGKPYFARKMDRFGGGDGTAV
jgi:hypothetical protein